MNRTAAQNLLTGKHIGLHDRVVWRNTEYMFAGFNRTGHFLMHRIDENGQPLKAPSIFVNDIVADLAFRPVVANVETRPIELVDSTIIERYVYTMTTSGVAFVLELELDTLNESCTVYVEPQPTAAQLAVIQHQIFIEWPAQANVLFLTESD